MTALEKELAAAKEKYLPLIRESVAATAADKLALHTAVAGSLGLFQKPKTQIFHGIKVGFQKGKGKTEIANEETFLKRLETLFPDEAERGMYLNVQISPNKDALAGLPADVLKRLGVTITGASDAVVIKPIAGEVEKIVSALLKEAVEEEVKP